MGILDKKKSTTIISASFNNGREAYFWAFQRYIDKGLDELEASEKATEFATKHCEALGLPASFEPEKTGMAKVNYYLQEYTGMSLKEVSAMLLPALLTGVAGTLGGVALGANIANKNDAPPPPNPYDNLTKENGTDI